MKLPECKGKIEVFYDGKQVKIKAFGYKNQDTELITKRFLEMVKN